MADTIKAPVKGMTWVPGGAFAMGSDAFYPEERPVRRVEVEGFWIDRHPVTVAQFGRFVGETGLRHRGRAPARPRRLPGRRRGRPRAGLAGLPQDRAARSTWATSARGGATSRAPSGAPRRARRAPPRGRQRHPVTHVAYEDAAAYAAWAGKELPTEPEWERAARGGLEGAIFAWGDEIAPGGRLMANTWQGEFPWQNLRADGYEGTSPVGTFPPNGYGLYDMTGNVWEWTADYYATHDGQPGETRAARPACCPARTSRGASSRAARTCARRTTACASAPPRARARRSTPRRRTSAFAASCGRPVPDAG